VQRRQSSRAISLTVIDIAHLVEQFSFDPGAAYDQMRGIIIDP